MLMLLMLIIVNQYWNQVMLIKLTVRLYNEGNNEISIFVLHAML